MISERAPAKVNLVLQVGARRSDGLHELCSLFAALELADTVEVEARDGGQDVLDRIECPGVEGPNLAEAALASYRAVALPEASLPPLAVRIEKRIPVAGGMAGGSADAAAVLRAADALSERPLGVHELRRLAARLGSDVPSQVAPGHAIVTGAGERIEPVELPTMGFVLVPQKEGLSTAAVYAEADRTRATRSRLEPARLREALSHGTFAGLVPYLENDLQAAAFSLRPELADVRDRLLGAGAAAALVSGSGPTVVGVFPDRASAARAADAVPGAFPTGLLGAASEGSPRSADAPRSRGPSDGRDAERAAATTRRP